MRFLVDEDMPRSTARRLREARFDADDVRDIGLRGEADERVFQEAQTRNAVLITEDVGFASATRFPEAMQGSWWCGSRQISAWTR